MTRLPPGLPEEAVLRGERLVRRRARTGAILWLLLAGLVLTFGVWAATVKPWEPPHRETTPTDSRW